MNGEILLTVTMLVSNREDTIEKCMSSIKHLLDAVPSELIVVDTAGNQACMDIVRRYTDNIVEFEWCNDFAAARNAGVKKARGQWLMFLDDDEWFESTENLESFFLSGEYRNYNAAAYIQRNYGNKAGTVWRDSNVLRVCKREKDTRFYGKIHEIFVPLKEPIYYTDDYVHHYGYIYDTPQKSIEHSWRNIKPLLEMHRENKNDYHTVAQLIQEYWIVKEFFSLIELSKQLRRNSDAWTPRRVRYTTYVVVTEMRSYMVQQRYGDAYEVGKELLERQDVPLLARMCFCCQMSDICNQLERYDEALEYMKIYDSARTEWGALPEQDKRKLDIFGIVAQYTAQEVLDHFTLLKLHIYVLQEKWTEAGQTLLTFDWGGKGRKILKNTPKDIVSTLKEVPYDQRYLAILERFEGDKVFPSLVYTELERSDPKTQDLLMAYLRVLPLRDIRMCQCHITYAGARNDAALAVSVLEAMREQNLPFFLKDKAYWDSLYQLDIDINSYMTALSGYDWMEMARVLWMQMPIDICETAYLCLIRGLDKSDVKYTFISALMMEKRLFADTKQEQEESAIESKDTETSAQPETRENQTAFEAETTGDLTSSESTEKEETTVGTEGEDTMVSAQEAEPTVKKPQPAWMSMAPEEVWDKLNQLSQYWITCAATLYREEVFVTDLFRNLPSAYQFGWYIMQANAVKSQNTNLFLIKVADAAKAYPVMKELCKKVITAYKDV